MAGKGRQIIRQVGTWRRVLLMGVGRILWRCVVCGHETRGAPREVAERVCPGCRPTTEPAPPPKRHGRSAIRRWELRYGEPFPYDDE